MKQLRITWRRATEEEIQKGEDHPVNKGMVIESQEWVEGPNEDGSIPINIEEEETNKQ